METVACPPVAAEFPSGYQLAMLRDAHALNLSWLTKLRWGAICAQAAAVLASRVFMGNAWHWVPLALLVAAGVASNFIPLWWLRRQRPVSEWMIGCLMVVDVLLLTGLLTFSGGPFNPFSVLYLVNIALAAVVLRPVWTWGLFVLSLACFGALFIEPLWFPRSDSHAAHMAQMELHMRGMWGAFGVAASLIVYFVHRVRRALAERDRELADARALQHRNERLASLATLAAGAAHELATPLSTIAVIAKEQERALSKNPSLACATEDARLIRQQVDRCREILSHMTADAGTSAGEAPVCLRVGDLVRAAVDTEPAKERIAIVSPECDATVVVPATALAQALRSVIKNGLQATDASGHVQLRTYRLEQELRIEVRDAGCGMSEDTLRHAGEPFFTTKPPGEGMGLGLFLTRTVLERLGGRLLLESRPGRGTTATLVLPQAEAA